MARSSLFESLKLNVKATSLTWWYGTIGIASYGFVPFIGQMNKPLAIACGLLPIASRFNQTDEIAEDHTEVRKNKWSYYGKAAAKALVNSGMAFICAYTTFHYGSNVSCWLLGAWCTSKIITLGNGSPIEHFEGWFSIEKNKTGARKSFLQSLSKNVESTSKATFYGIIAMATFLPKGIAMIGKLNLFSGLMFAALPFLIRMHQISIMSSVVSPQNQTYFRAKALVDTIIDMGMGGIIYFASLSNNPQITIAVLIGWIFAKLTSGGDFSPLDHFSLATANLFGAALKQE